MADDRDPRTPTPTTRASGSAGRWIAIILAIILVLLLLAWFGGWWGGTEVATVPADDTNVIVPEEEAVAD